VRQRRTGLKLIHYTIVDKQDSSVVGYPEKIVWKTVLLVFRRPQ